jgi:hypothetical protein
MRSGLLLAILAIPVTAFGAGCVNPFGQPETTGTNPGQAVGSFSVNATEGPNTCGAGALGSPTAYTFNVSMSVDGSVIYWNDGNGTVVPGTLAADGVSFTFQTSTVTDMRAMVDTSSSDASSSSGGVPLPPCSIEREDSGVGTLVGDATGVTSFSGTLTYGFTPTTGSNCLDLIENVMPTFATLPCSMSYAMSGSRTQ